MRFDAFSVSLDKDHLGDIPAMPTTESLSTAVLIKETRKRLGLTQLQFAKTLGVSFQSVNRWERCKTKPLPIVLKQIEVMVKEMGARGEDLLEQYFLKDKS
ncbi:helix-turn-helix domain-containing protein [Microcoleus sp. FACHB-SPT15]|uniref:helix-turn-helix domain-containing protein n=1 Tax=Microcoleus sp. FACHB-SPT15 TaxID=2692830 RepID=UPI0028C4F476|nr:helix-turn-helix domain-containing protein [Microcoleus sp. FACHB-SPT15]